MLWSWGTRGAAVSQVLVRQEDGVGLLGKSSVWVTVAWTAGEQGRGLRAMLVVLHSVFYKAGSDQSKSHSAPECVPVFIMSHPMGWDKGLFPYTGPITGNFLSTLLFRDPEVMGLDPFYLLCMEAKLVDIRVTCYTTSEGN